MDQAVIVDFSFQLQIPYLNNSKFYNSLFLYAVNFFVSHDCDVDLFVCFVVSLIPHLSLYCCVFVFSTYVYVPDFNLNSLILVLEFFSRVILFGKT